MYNTGERSEPEKIIIIRKKQPLDPLSYTYIHIRPHLWQISGGGGVPDPLSPLWIRAWYNISESDTT